MSEWLVLCGTVAAAVSGVPGLLTRRTSMRGQWLTTSIAVLGALLGLVGISWFWATPYLGNGFVDVLPVPVLMWPLVPGAEFRVAVDGLSAIFLLPVFLIS